MLTVQEFPSALSVPTTLAARPLSARSLLRTLRVALRDGGREGWHRLGHAVYHLGIRACLASFISSIPRSICSVVIALTPPLGSTFISRGTNITSNFKKIAGLLRITLLIACRPPIRKARCSSAMVSAFSALRARSGLPPGFPDENLKLKSPPYRGAT